MNVCSDEAIEKEIQNVPPAHLFVRNKMLSKESFPTTYSQLRPDERALHNTPFHSTLVNPCTCVRRRH